MAKRIRVNVFDDLREALTDALAFERGQKVDLRVTELPAPPKPLSPAAIKIIRLSLSASQAKFAKLLNASLNTVESWEQGVRKPHGTALKLLTIASKYPHILLLTAAKETKRHRRGSVRASA
jgi:putative transcriptional regulator